MEKVTLFPAKGANRCLLLLVTFLIGQYAYCVPSKDYNTIKINFNCASKKIGGILEDLSIKYGCKFTYINNDIPTDKIVSVNCDSCTIKLLLDKIFYDEPISNKQVLSQIILFKIDSLVKKPIKVIDSNEVVRSTTKDSSIKMTKIVNGVRYTIYDYLKFKRIKVLGGGIDASINYEDSLKIISDTIIFAEEMPLEGAKVQIVENKKFSINYKSGAWKIYLSPYLGLGYSFRTYTNKDGEIKSNRNLVEYAMLSREIGLLLNYQASKRFFYSVGFAFSSFGEKGRYFIEITSSNFKGGQFPNNDPRHPRSFTDPNNFVIQDTSINYSNIYYQMIVPLNVGFSVGNKFGFRSQLAIVPGLNIGRHINYVDTTMRQFSGFQNPPPPPNFNKNYYYIGYLDGNNHSYKVINFSGRASMSLFYKVSRMFRVCLGADLTYSISNLYKSTSEKYNSYRLNGHIGLDILIKKVKNDNN